MTGRETWSYILADYVKFPHNPENDGKYGCGADRSGCSLRFNRFGFALWLASITSQTQILGRKWRDVERIRRRVLGERKASLMDRRYRVLRGN